MILTDVNVLIYAFRKDTDNHIKYKKWLENALIKEPFFGYSDIVLSAVIRITTHPRIFSKPSQITEVFKFTNFIISQPNSIAIYPDQRHWEIFQNLCKETSAKGNLVADAYLAALAIESGAEWITTNRDFAHFPCLKWRHPLG